MPPSSGSCVARPALTSDWFSMRPHSAVSNEMSTLSSVRSLVVVAS